MRWRGRGKEAAVRAIEAALPARRPLVDTVHFWRRSLSSKAGSLVQSPGPKTPEHDSNLEPVLWSPVVTIFAAMAAASPLEDKTTERSGSRSLIGGFDLMVEVHRGI